MMFHRAPGELQSELAEMDEHLGYHEYERSDNPDYRNGKKTKKIRGNFGETEIQVPQDRDGTFEPKVVKKRQKDISGIEQKIISLYAKGMTTRQISETIEDIYGFEVSDGMVSDITDRLLPQIEDWLTAHESLEHTGVLPSELLRVGIGRPVEDGVPDRIPSPHSLVTVGSEVGVVHLAYPVLTEYVAGNVEDDALSVGSRTYK